MRDESKSESEDLAKPVGKPRTPWFRAVIAFCSVLAVYFLVAYVLMPLFWVRYAHRHPALDETPGITLTGDDHPGDPINVALIGSEAQVKLIMEAPGGFRPIRWGCGATSRSQLTPSSNGSMTKRPLAASTSSAAKRIWPSSSLWATIPASGTTCGIGNRRRSMSRAVRCGLVP